MIQSPKDILADNIHLGLNGPNMYGMIITYDKDAKHIDLMQTTHCLEIVLAGELEVRQAARREKLRAGELHIRRRGNYQLYPSEDFKSLALFFENDFVLHFLNLHVREYKHDKNRFDIPNTMKFQVNDFMLANVNEALANINRPKPFSRCIVKFTTHQVLLQVLASDFTLSCIHFLRNLASERKIDLAYFMEENFTRKLSIADMSRMTGRSISVFKKDFMEQFHTSPVRWQINRRLEYANYLIASTDEQISVIAYNCGFENISHFSKAYKLKFGYSPVKTRSVYVLEEASS